MNKEKGFTEVKTSVVLGISGQAMSPKVILSKKTIRWEMIIFIFSNNLE